MATESDYETALDILAVLDSNGCECRSCGLVERMSAELVRDYEGDHQWVVLWAPIVDDQAPEAGLVG